MIEEHLAKVRFARVTITEDAPNVEFSGDAPLHGAASAGTQGYASADDKGKRE